jgi:uncharacterized protein (TIGR00251 family)
MRAREAAGGGHGPVVPVWARHDPHSGAVLLSLHVQPGASRTQCCGEHDGRLKLRVATRPTEGAANRAVLDFLATTLGVPMSDVRLISGMSSRRKVIAVSGAGAPALERLCTA